MKRQNILVIDDERDIAEGICDFINFKFAEQFKAIPLYGKKELVRRTLEATREHSPSLAVVDLVLNGVDGVDLSKMVIQEQPNIKILYLTGCPRTDALRKKADLEGHQTLLKPCDGREVLLRVIDLLDLNIDV